MKFDTRDKKPKLWNIAVISAIVLVFLVVLVFLGLDSPQMIRIAAPVFFFYLVLVIVLLVVAFFRQLQYNPYSYNTIYYSGFAFFLVSVLLSQIQIVIRVVIHKEESALGQLLLDLAMSAITYMSYTLPLILAFSILLILSNLVLLRREGFRLDHMLAIILAILMMLGEAFLLFTDHFAGDVKNVMWKAVLVNLFAALYLYFESMVIGSFIADIIAARYQPEKDRDAIIILGCGLRKDGTPSSVLAGRIDRAFVFYWQQAAETGKAPLLIASGGKGSDEKQSEAASIAAYLKGKGVPEEHIVEEDRSRTTFENMKFSKQIIDELKPGGKIAFATTNYHVFRSGLFARRVKMRAVGIGAKTKWYFWPNAGVREFASLLTHHRLKQTLILGGMILIYSLLTIAAFLIGI